LEGICLLLDDQAVRFDIWDTEVDARNGILELRATEGVHPEGKPRCLELVTEILKDLYSASGRISRHMIALLYVLESQNPRDRYVLQRTAFSRDPPLALP